MMLWVGKVVRVELPGGVIAEGAIKAMRTVTGGQRFLAFELEHGCTLWIAENAIVPETLR